MSICWICSSRRDILLSSSTSRRNCTSSLRPFANTTDYRYYHTMNCEIIKILSFLWLSWGLRLLELYLLFWFFWLFGLLWLFLGWLFSLGLLLAFPWWFGLLRLLFAEVLAEEKAPCDQEYQNNEQDDDIFALVDGNDDFFLIIQ